MTVIETLPTTFAGGDAATLPVYKVDPIVESGTMFLLEPAASWDAGIPAHGAAVSNLAASRLAKRGLPTGISWVMDPETNNGVNGKIERTAKGGIHLIMSQASPLPTDKGAAVPFPDWFPQYVLDNQTHKFAWSVWQRPTRAFGGTGSWVTSVLQNSNIAQGIGSVPYMGFSSSQALAPYRTAKEVTPVTPNVTEMSVESRRHAISFGKRNNPNRTIVTGVPSLVIYRMTLEDLTVTGRTFADFSAVDTAEYSKAFGTGGRYANDTFTDPATLA